MLWVILSSPPACIAGRAELLETEIGASKLKNLELCIFFVTLVFWRFLEFFEDFFYFGFTLNLLTMARFRSEYLRSRFFRISIMKSFHNKAILEQNDAEIGI